MKNTNKGLAVVLAAAILASGGGIASSVVTATPAYATSSQTQIDAAVAQILKDTNAERAKVGLAPVTLSPGMNDVSQKWTQKMAAEDYLRHNPTYSRELPRAIDGATSENIAFGFTANDVVTEGWMKSTTGHRENLLGNWTHMGLGYYVDDNGTTWFTQNFGRYNLNLTTPYASTNTSQTREATVGWYGTIKESITDYKVELYSPTGELLQTKLVPSVNDSNPYYRATFTGLTPETTYTVKTTARNTTVMGTEVVSPTRTTQLTTLQEYPAPSAPNPPSYPTATNILHNHTTLGWGAPTGVVGTITGYTVTVKEAGKADRILQTTETSINITDLTENTAYTMEVVANVLGADQKTRTVSPAASLAVETPVYYPVSVNAPTSLSVSAVSHDAATVSWTTPTGTVGKLLSYTVTVRSAAGEKVYTTPSTYYRITGLSATTGYTVVVQANAVSVDELNRATSMGAATIFTTSIAPSPIVKVAAPAVTVSKVAYNGFTVSWPQPAVTGKITNYHVIIKLGTRIVKVHDLNAATRALAITGLAENTNYTVSVVAMAISPNGLNRVSATTTKTVKTGLTAASTVRVAPPAGLVTATSRTAVTAAWKKPAVTGRVVNYTVTLKQGTRVIKTLTTTGGKASFAGLRTNTAYTVYVTANAVSANGKYKASATATKNVRTLR